MKGVFLNSLVLGFFLSSVAYSQSKQGQINIDPQKKEGTVNLDKSGTWQGGLTEPPKKPEAFKSEQDKREEQKNMGGQVFIRKTF